MLHRNRRFVAGDAFTTLVRRYASVLPKAVAFESQIAHARARANMMRADRNAALAALAIGGLLLAERARPLRGGPREGWRREARNVGLAVLAGVAVALVERPATEAALRLAERRRWGLHRLAAPAWAKTVVALMWLDYGLYVWHVLLHREPLWRLHRPHHSDLEVTASTALRLHAGEMLLSAPWRAAQAALLGVSGPQLALWRAVTTAATLFQHADLRLPAWLDRTLAAVVVTPRMHGIHHSVVPDEVGSNWGVILTWWDRLHGTLRLGRPQRPDGLGVPDERDPARLRLGRLLAMPLEPAGPRRVTSTRP